MRKILTALTVAGALAISIGLAPPAHAQKKPIVKESKVTTKATITSIDHDQRLITLKDKKGNTQTVSAGPEIRRVDELKVGDTVTVRATRTTVYKILKPEASAPAPAKDEAIVRGAGERPSATVTEQKTSTVTVKSIDQKAPSLTVVDENGKTVSYSVKDKGDLKNLKPGDKIVIYYTLAKAISIED